MTTRFDSLYGDESRTLKRLPPYAFGDGTRFWRELDTAPAAPAPSARPGRSAAPAPESDTPESDPSESATSAGYDTIAAKVRHLIADIGGYTSAEIDPNALLGEDLGYDSLLQLRLIDRIRTEYPQLEDAPVDELLLAIKSVDDVVAYVADRISSEGVTR
jgi:acyl carrier protein